MSWGYVPDFASGRLIESCRLPCIPASLERTGAYGLQSRVGFKKHVWKYELQLGFMQNLRRRRQFQLTPIEA